MSATHEHVWKQQMHLDACHSYQTIYVCECGAGRRVWAERDLDDDPYSVAWMANTTGEACERCEALLNGAKPERGDEIVEAANSQEPTDA